MAKATGAGLAFLMLPAIYLCNLMPGNNALASLGIILFVFMGGFVTCSEYWRRVYEQELAETVPAKRDSKGRFVKYE